MNRMPGALRRAALLVAVAVAVAVAVVVAVRTQGGSGGPHRHKVVLPEPAPASAQWIVNTVTPQARRPARCPVPTLATLAVLDSEGQSRAEAFWLIDNVDVCWVTIDGNGAVGVGSATIDSLTVEHPMPPDQTPGAESYAITAFRGRVEDLRATGDTDRLLGPVHSRAVDLGGGRFVTFVSYGVRIPEEGEGDDLTLNLCPPAGDCRDASLYRLRATGPAGTGFRPVR
ncbi:hypothetical protein [Kitasatospora sp. NPDC086791]|uniref:hypothetical protein n=1 Tax=Kitasatospora sp. NPDC086791 TaxID=3155178 RepID=UPI00341739F0